MKLWKEWAGKMQPFILKYKYLLLVIAAGAFLLLLPLSNTDNKTADSQSADDAETYDITEMEGRIEEILAKINGVGKVSVMLTVKTGMETVYAGDESRSVSQSQSGDGESSYSSERDQKPAVISSDTGESPLPVKEIYPEYQGIVIVCDGADNATVCLSIANAMYSILGIGADKVTILKMKQ